MEMQRTKLAELHCLISRFAINVKKKKNQDDVTLVWEQTQMGSHKCDGNASGKGSGGAHSSSLQEVSEFQKDLGQIFISKCILGQIIWSIILCC